MGQTYERVVKRQATGRWRTVRLAICAGYVCFALLWVAPIIASLFHPALIALAALLTASLVLLTKKYLHVEYEYVFVSGSLTVAKILGKQTRRTLFAGDLCDALLIAPVTDKYLDRAEDFELRRVIDARSAPDADALLIVAEEDRERRVLLLIDSDKETRAICHRACVQGCAREL